MKHRQVLCPSLAPFVTSESHTDTFFIVSHIAAESASWYVWAPEVPQPISNVHYVRATSVSSIVERHRLKGCMVPLPSSCSAADISAAFMSSLPETCQFRLVPLMGTESMGKSDEEEDDDEHASPVAQTHRRVASSSGLLQHVSSGLFVEAALQSKGLIWLHSDADHAAIATFRTSGSSSSSTQQTHVNKPPEPTTARKHSTVTTRWDTLLDKEEDFDEHESESTPTAAGVNRHGSRTATDVYITLASQKGASQRHRHATFLTAMYSPLSSPATPKRDIAVHTPNEKSLVLVSLGPMSLAEALPRLDRNEFARVFIVPSAPRKAAATASSAPPRLPSGQFSKRRLEVEVVNVDHDDGAESLTSESELEAPPLWSSEIEMEDAAPDYVLQEAQAKGDAFTLFVRKKISQLFMQDKCIGRKSISHSDKRRARGSFLVCTPPGAQPFTVIGFGPNDLVVAAARRASRGAGSRMMLKVSEDPLTANCFATLLRGGVPDSASSCLVPVILTSRAVAIDEYFVIDASTLSLLQTDHGDDFTHYVSCRQQRFLKQMKPMDDKTYLDTTTPPPPLAAPAVGTSSEDTEGLSEEFDGPATRFVSVVTPTSPSDVTHPTVPHHIAADIDVKLEEVDSEPDGTDAKVEVSGFEGKPAIHSVCLAELSLPPRRSPLSLCGISRPTSRYFYGNYKALSLPAFCAVVEYPFTLLEIRPCHRLPGQLEVVARYPVLKGTCFLYCGPRLHDGSGGVSTYTPFACDDGLESDQSDTAAAATSPESTAMGIDAKGIKRIEGGNMMRFVNHYFGFASSGNVAFRRGAVMFTRSPESVFFSKGRRNRSAVDEEHVVFFVALRDIEPGEPLLADSYGPEFNSFIERIAMCQGRFLSVEERTSAAAHACSSLPASSVAFPDGYIGCYMGDIRVGSIVGKRMLRKNVRGQLHPGMLGGDCTRSYCQRMGSGRVSSRLEAARNDKVMKFFLVIAEEDNAIIVELLDDAYPMLRRSGNGKFHHGGSQRRHDTDHVLEEAERWRIASFTKTEVVLFVPGWDYVDHMDEGGLPCIRLKVSADCLK